MEATTAETISAVANSVTAFAASAAVFVAYREINAWRREHRGKIESTLAGQIWHYISELQLLAHDLRDMWPVDNDQKRGELAAWNVRWEDKSNALLPLMYQADIVWDDKGREWAQSLLNNGRELYKSRCIFRGREGRDNAIKEYDDLVKQAREFLRKVI